MTRRQQIGLALSIAISAVFMIIAFRGLNPGAVWESIRNAQFGWLVVGFLTSFAVRLVVTRRWKYLIDGIRPVPFDRLYQLVNIGYMGNNIYPFRAGEAIRCVLLRRSHGIPLAQSAVSILVERAFDGIVMVTFVVAGLLMLDLQSDELRQGTAIVAVWFFAATAMFFFLALRPSLFRRVVEAIAGRLPQAVGGRMSGLAEDVLSGLTGLRSPRDLAGAVATSYLTWMIEALAYTAVAAAFGLPINYILMLVAVGAVNLAQIIPSSPGALGLFEYAASTVLIAFGIAETQAIAYALLVHVIIWLPPTLHGFVILSRQGLALRALARAREEME